MKIKADKAEVAAILEVYQTDPRPKPFDPVDLSRIESIREQARKPPGADFSGEHNLFNPVRWIKRPEGTLEKIDESNYGASRVKVEGIQPLEFTVKFDQISGGGYYFTVTQESAENPRDRRPKRVYASTQSARNDVFTLKAVNGPEDDPITFEIEINETGEKIVVNRNTPYVANAGYSANLSYPLERDKEWKDVRVKQQLVFANDTNIVVDISPREVILRAVSNEKPTTIPYNPAP
jgi:hypothetical protein